MGSFPSDASPYGALDMAGNAIEWVNDWYDSACHSGSPGSNPQGPATGTYKVLRGGGRCEKHRAAEERRCEGNRQRDPRRMLRWCGSTMRIVWQTRYS